MKQEAEYDWSWHNKKKVPHRLGWRVVINILLGVILNSFAYLIQIYMKYVAIYEEIFLS